MEWIRQLATKRQTFKTVFYCIAFFCLHVSFLNYCYKHFSAEILLKNALPLFLSKKMFEKNVHFRFRSCLPTFSFCLHFLAHFYFHPVASSSPVLITCYVFPPTFHYYFTGFITPLLEFKEGLRTRSVKNNLQARRHAESCYQQMVVRTSKAILRNHIGIFIHFLIIYLWRQSVSSERRGQK